jgi:hypothetical protein
MNIGGETVSEIGGGSGLQGISEIEVIGLSELVAAIVLPHHQPLAAWSYWKTYVRLVLEEFGLTVEKNRDIRWLDMAIQDLNGGFLPFMGALEVPKVVGMAFQTVGNISQIDAQISNCQKRFIEALILAIDPGAQTRTTTLSHLRERGLIGEPYFEIEDY